MNSIKRFFQEDLLAVFSAGKHRISLIQLTSRLGQLEKQKTTLINELGVKAWEGRVKDERYASTYAKLEEIDLSLGQVQVEIDSLQSTINQETTQLNSVSADFNNRSKGTQSQRQEALQKLAQIQSGQKNLELRLGQLQLTVSQGTTNVQNMQNQVNQLMTSTLADKDEKIASLLSTINTVQTQINEAAPQIDALKMELESNQTEQQPLKSELDGYNQLINMLQEQNKSTMGAIQQKLSGFQQDLLKLTEKKNKFLNQISALTPELGGQVFRHRPVSTFLSAIYDKVDGLQNEIKGASDELNLTQARLSSVNSGSVRKVAIVGGLLFLLLACLIIVPTVIIPNVSRMLKPDPKRDIRMVENWTLENCSVNGYQQDEILEIAVWENKRGDAFASAEITGKLLGANEIVLDSESVDLVIAPDGLAVSVFELNPDGSRVEEVEQTVGRAFFTESSLNVQKDINVKSFFEKSRNSDNISIALELTNQGDFGLRFTENAFALVLNNKNEFIDILGGNNYYEDIDIDSITTIEFNSLNYSGSSSCLQSDYSQEKVTFWYFIPLEYTTNSAEQFLVSGQVDYTP